MPGRELIDELRRDYRTKKPLIVKRLAEFKKVYEKGDRAIFEELCYCILTAGSSAKMGMRTVEALKDILQNRQREGTATARQSAQRPVLAPPAVVHRPYEGISR